MKSRQIRMTFWGRKDRGTADAPQAPTDGDVFVESSPVGHVPPPSGRWIGHIDNVNETTIVGWCCDADHPDTSVAVEAVASNGRRLVTVASIFRADVMDAGWGNGNHGFEIDIAKLNATNDTVTVRFLESQSQIGAEHLVVNSKDALLSGRLPPAYLGLMRQLAIDVQVHHAELKAGAALS